MARFPSLKTLVTESTATARRFPLTLLSAIAGALVAICMIDIKYDDHETQKVMACVLLVCSLGLTLFFSLTVYSERKGHSLSKMFLLQAIAGLLLAGYYVFLRLYFVQIEFIRYALVNIALHLFVSFAAYTGRNNLNGFWQFNKALFLRMFFSAIYSVTLYLGLCLAIVAIDQLFNVNMEEKIYFRLWIIITGIFNTWFFLAGVPKNLPELDASEEYPKGLKIFTQYVLLPLVTLYLLILYAYMGKIIVTQNLPKGWVSYLVIGFSVAGVLALLLIHPIRNKEGNNWIHIFSKWFYGALYPLVIMLFIAIGRRINDYGVTENRYFIIVLAVWLACVSTYFLFSKVQNIKLIPISLCLIALLSSFGPWGAFAVSERSQFNTLERILSDNGVLLNGKLDKKHKAVSDSIAEQVTSIVKYFDNMHGFEKFRPWFDQNIDTLIADTLRWTRTVNVMKLLNIKESYNYGYYRGEDGETYHYFSYYPEYSYQQVRKISGYDYDINFNATAYENATGNNHTIERDTFRFSITNDSTALEITKNSAPFYKLQMQEFLKAINDSIKNDSYNNSVPQRFMEKTAEDSTFSIKLQFNNIYGYVRNKNHKTNSVGGNCLLKFKNADTR